MSHLAVLPQILLFFMKALDTFVYNVLWTPLQQRNPKDKTTKAQYYSSSQQKAPALQRDYLAFLKGLDDVAD